MREGKSPKKYPPRKKLLRGPNLCDESKDPTDCWIPFAYIFFKDIPNTCINFRHFHLESKFSTPLLQKQFCFVFKQNQLRAMPNSAFEDNHETLFRLYLDNTKSVCIKIIRIIPRQKVSNSKTRTNPEERLFFRNRVDSSTSRSQTFKVLIGNLFVTIFDVLHF